MAVATGSVKPEPESNEAGKKISDKRILDVLAKMDSSKQGGSDVGAASTANYYYPVPIPSALLLDSCQTVSLAFRSGADIPRHENINSAALPWTCKTRSPFLLKTGTTATQRWNWGLSSADWIRTKDFSEKPSVGIVTQTTLGGSRDEGVSDSKRSRLE